MKRIYLLILLLVVFTINFAQNVYVFRKGLLARVPQRYGREAIYSDLLAYKMYTGTLAVPSDSSVFSSVNGVAVKWQALSADSLDRLRPRSFGPGGGGGRGGGGSYIYVTYQSDKDQTAILNTTGSSSVFVNGELHMGDTYNLGYLNIPVALKKGLNEFYIRAFTTKATLTFPSKPVLLNIDDPTVPYIVLGNTVVGTAANGTSNNIVISSGARNPQPLLNPSASSLNPNLLSAAITIINTTTKDLKGLTIKTIINNKESLSNLPTIPALSTRKIPFTLDPEGVTKEGQYPCRISLYEKSKLIDTATITIEAVNPTAKYSNTFISNIDGSLQYFAVTPQTPGPQKNAALFLSVHGAGVEAIGQAKAYQSKDWGTLVAATNRRPRGFNWEDWGRLDALEVLEIGKDIFQPDPQRIYLTGHSMGGHGTWFLGATYPDKWAAIAPCAGYPTLKGYGSADGLIPDSGSTAMEQTLIQSGNQSDVPKLVSNYKNLGIYVLHGDADPVVSVNYARQMRKLLGDFHPDLSYYEYPGGSHWFGDQSVDWKPIFEFFKWHSIPVDTAVNTIDFMTSNPGISSSYHWASVLQQNEPLKYSRIKLNRNKQSGNITGTTENVKTLKFDLKNFGTGVSISVKLDNSAALKYTTVSANDSVVLVNENGTWVIAAQPSLAQKGPHRYGTFKDAFNNRMVFVYGTSGNAAENKWSLSKARYDAETWYYRGNGAVDIISDKEFSLEKYKDRGVILFGNKSTNSAWSSLLNDCPIQVDRNQIAVGEQSWKGDDLGAYFVWPIKNSSVASVAVVTGTGLKGMNAANANQYFAGASGFPDYMVFDVKMLEAGTAGLKAAGFFNNDWSLR